MNTQSLYCCILASSLFFHEIPSRNTLAQPHATPSHTADSTADVVCGPRCVQFVLSWFGRTEELADLVQEMQAAHFGTGTSLADIEQALHKRNVPVKPFSFEPGSFPSSARPIILHLATRQGNATSLGHFVVLLPDGTHRQARLWTGLSGEHVGDFSLLTDRLTGVALACSDDLSRDVTVVPTALRADAVDILCITSIAVGLLCASIGIARKRCRKIVTVSQEI